jgi:hypothetical protein
MVEGRGAREERDERAWQIASFLSSLLSHH